MKLSILICTHNRIKMLQQLLNTVIEAFNMNKEPTQIIIIDNCSTDNTNSIIESELRKYQDPNLEFMVIYEPKPGKANALTTGMKHIAGDYVIFLDDDLFLYPNSLKIIRKIIERHPNHIIGSLNIPISDKPLPKWFFNEAVQRAYACGPQQSYYDKCDYSVIGAGMILPTSLTKKLNNLKFKFHVSGRTGKSLLSGSDQELSIMAKILGYKGVFPDEYKLKHFITSDRISNWKFLKLNHYFGMGDSMLAGYKNYLKSHLFYPDPIPSALKLIIKMVRNILEIFIHPSRAWANIASFMYKLGVLRSILFNRKSITKNIKSVSVQLSRFTSENN